MQDPRYTRSGPLPSDRRLALLTCPNCGGEFRPKEKRSKFCSWECYRKQPRPPCTPRVCSVVGCERSEAAKGYCKTHYTRQWRTGDVGADQPVRVIKWGTGQTVTPAGYRRVYAPNADGVDCNGYIFEHRLVMAEVIGRPLLTAETVHHRNGNRLDNRPENLELHASRHPRGQRVTDLIDFAAEILALYAPERLR